MSETTSSSGIPLLTTTNYAEWSLKLSAAVMKKANIEVMLGTSPMPTLLPDLSNAKQVCEWQMYCCWFHPRVHQSRSSYSLH
jgi:hypothetical protein